MNPKEIVRVLFFAACAFVLAGCSLMPPDMRMGAGPAYAPVTPFTAVERDFVTRIATRNVYEIEVSKLAVEKGMSPAVRDYAQTMVVHHTQMNNELVDLMSLHGVPPPKGLPADRATKLHRLAALPRSDAFDNGYIRVIGIEDHRASIAMYEKARREVKNKDLRAYIERSITIMRTHLTMAQNTLASING
jgi:putative membrane protein